MLLLYSERQLNKQAVGHAVMAFTITNSSVTNDMDAA